ncbi:hypothetical protein [Rosistilla oblonga]|uniref:hypothetical protein n=1 Tax=Rosistilla oblonga TaxID=2527990 RepID=UPI003A974939
MNDDEIRQLVTDHGFTGEIATDALRLCREVERETRSQFFSIIQHANNAANARSITPRELDRFVWDAEEKKRQQAK